VIDFPHRLTFGGSKSRRTKSAGMNCVITLLSMRHKDCQTLDSENIINLTNMSSSPAVCQTNQY
jgi:hypothetical protein